MTNPKESFPTTEPLSTVVSPPPNDYSNDIPGLSGIDKQTRDLTTEFRPDLLLERMLASQTNMVNNYWSPMEGLDKLVANPMEFQLEKWVTQDPEMLDIKMIIRKIKLYGSRKPILITGPTGTGKELLARALTIPGQPFIAQNCGGLPSSLVESIFFGYVKGAFTGATTDRIGLLEEAASGIIFLDEIGDMEMPVQAKFLRAIQEGEIYRVGAVKPTAIKCQFIAATKYDLEHRIEVLLFRDDLFARLRTFELKISGLKDRSLDIPLIALSYGWNNPLPDLLLPDIYHDNVRAIQCYIERMKVIGYYNSAHKMLLEKHEQNESSV